MAKAKLQIGFGGNQVSVFLPDYRVSDKVRILFGAMVEEEESNIIGAISVRESHGGFTLQKNDEADLLDCSPYEIMNALRSSATTMLIDSRPDLLWVHAGAVSSRDRAVLFLGANGMGKSTLVMHLCSAGWGYLSDDLAPLDLDAEKVLPFPQTPRVREHPGREIPRERLHELNKIKLVLSPETISKKSAVIRGIFFPEYSVAGPTELKPCPKSLAVLGLIRNAVNFDVHDSETVRKLCSLVEKLPTYNLPFSDAGLACDLVRQVC